MLTPMPVNGREHCRFSADRVRANCQWRSPNTGEQAVHQCPQIFGTTFKRQRPQVSQGL
jgi:hypothetical protein